MSDLAQKSRKELHSLLQQLATKRETLADVERFDGVLEELIQRGMPFGRYEGIPLPNLPPHYIRWVRELYDKGEIYEPLSLVLAHFFTRQGKEQAPIV